MSAAEHVPVETVGSYRIVRKLGEGGMGAVYEAVHKQIGRRAAIKLLRPEHSSNQELLARFFNEARAVNIVQHPSLVGIYEFGQTPDGAAYIVMEYLAGDSLRARLKKVGGRLGSSCVLIARQIATALAATHDKRIIHRDLKPDNVMLVPDPEVPGGERVKVLDFGIAKLSGDVGPEGVSIRTRTGAVLGTPRYMAPEQCRGNTPVEEHADVYALGVMLFEMVAGVPPFQSNAFGELVALHMFAAPPPLRLFAPEAPEELLHLVHQMLAKSASERPSMAEVAQRLGQLEERPDAGFRPANEGMAINTLTMPEGPGMSEIAERLGQLDARTADGPSSESQSTGPATVTIPPTPVPSALIPPAAPVAKRWRGIAAASVAVALCAGGLIAFRRGLEPSPESTTELPSARSAQIAAPVAPVAVISSVVSTSAAAAAPDVAPSPSAPPVRAEESLTFARDCVEEEKAGRFKAAVTACQKALSSNPDQIELQRALRRAERALARKSPAHAPALPSSLARGNENPPSPTFQPVKPLD